MFGLILLELPEEVELSPLPYLQAKSSGVAIHF